MSPELIGAAVGAVLGLVNFVVLWWIAGRAELSNDVARQRGARVVKLVAWLDLPVFPIVGYFIGPMAFG